ncbi:glycerol acyltransferase [Solimonas fluminis]|uniref:Glycerol acyltransferase n=1 Tax=Solimonas fluminis TaxID=2086571 RepID=A0A2S5TC35_9GAMM|nr:lysophospholipid acyltransferase family protein [Solimonas fluminis]PPE72407.1 glycerol acyltransferase [Solimonas fluminis]
MAHTERFIVEAGPSVPRAPNAFRYWVGRSILTLTGWSVDVRLPDEPKLIIIAAPHSSNWDFVYGLAAIFVTQLHFNFFGKHTLFKGPLGGLFRRVGGIPVDRTAPGGLVAETVRIFESRPQLLLALTPEGTRSRVTVWKRGFWHMAQAANVPVAVAYIDYKRKKAGIEWLFRPTGNWEADMRPVFEFYRTVGAKRPDNFAVEQP